VLWQSLNQNTGSARHLVRVDGDGTVTALPDLPLPGDYVYATMAVAAGGGKVMVVYSGDDNQTLTVTLFDRNGTLLRSRQPSRKLASFRAVTAVAPARWMWRTREATRF
jgi:hypothetical protein